MRESYEDRTNIMPKYTFECHDCVVQFERTLKIGTHTTHSCPSCSEPAPLVMSGFGFEFAQGGTAAANSGVHDHDYPTADKAVGRSATSRWEHIRAREKVKKEARDKGQTPALIRHTGKDFIDYEPMSDVGRNARRKLVKEAIRVTGETKR